MKYLLLFACCLTSLVSAADPIVDKINDLDCDEDQKSKLIRAYEDYQDAVSNWQDVSSKIGLRPKQKSMPSIQADLVDPTIRRIQEQARKYHSRFEVLKLTQHKWGPSTNLLARAARQSMQSKLDTEREVAKWTRKIWKAKLKAEKKDKKIYENWIKDTEKARDKSSDEWKLFFQALLDQAAAAREDTVK